MVSKGGEVVRPQAEPGFVYGGVDRTRSSRLEAEPDGGECETVGRARVVMRRCGKGMGSASSSQGGVGTCLRL